jgi:hypothetical protein
MLLFALLHPATSDAWEDMSCNACYMSASSVYMPHEAKLAAQASLPQASEKASNVKEH